ncbi:MAG: LysM peptidoglycan-binding domain-containing protein [Treponema sp.]|nr:LysM peptidoglycan-binding domain-containing protein [Treponema sp.]
MKHKKYPKFEDYDFSDCREITGDALYRINGGGRIEPEQNENPPEGTSSNSSDNYTVQSGDTLSQIVYDYNQANGTHLTVDEVAALSGIENPDLILPGQSIVFSNPEQGGDSGQPVDPSVGVKALSGYIGGTIFIADGFNLLTSAFCKKSAEPICVPIFKELFLSSPYKDFGEVIETYKDSL